MSFTLAELSARFDLNIPAHQELKQRVDSILRGFARKQNYLFTSRLKTDSSFVQKLETGRFESSKLDDILAATLVVDTSNQIEGCISSLPSRIRIIDKRGPQGRTFDPDRFIFNDIILICLLEPTEPYRSEAGSIFALRFELQVKTLSEYAWGKATHDVAYKASSVDWRRLRLAAQLRAVTESTDLMYSQFETRYKDMPKGRSRSIERRTLVARRILGWASDGRIPDDAIPWDMARLSESITALCDAAGRSVQAMSRHVGDYLRGHSFPRSITVYRLWLGVAMTAFDASECIKRIRQSGLKLLVTGELEDIFPSTRSVPEDIRVQLSDVRA